MALKRETPSFTVEVRQNKRRTGLQTPKPHWVEAQLSIVNVEKPAQRAAAAAFRSPPLFAVETTAPAEAPAPRRILPSLVEAAEAAPPEPVEPAEPARPRRGRPPKSPTPVSAAEPHSETAAKPPADAPSSLRPATKPRAARKPRKAPVAQPSALPEPPARTAPAEVETTRAARNPGTFGRHVFRDGFKPGEGWKRRREARRARKD